MTDHTESSDPSQLWDIVSEALKKSPLEADWGLARSLDPKLAHFLQLGLGGIHMTCQFVPRDEQGPGEAGVSLYVDPGSVRPIGEFILAEPEAVKRIKPRGFDIRLANPDGLHFRPGEHDLDDWQSSGFLVSVAGIISPAGPELYQRLGPWYVESLETICNFMTEVQKWHAGRN